MIKLIRIDYRLLHGQVVVGWLNKLGIDRIVIVDNKAGSSDSEKSILNIAKPSGAKMHIFTVEEALARKIKLSNLKENTALIFGNVPSAYEFLKEFKAGDNTNEINYGAIPKKPDSKEFDKAVFLNDEDVGCSKKLLDLGYKIFSQQTPSAARKDLTNF